MPDTSFFDDTKPLPIGTELPKLNDEVVALGYPMGGERISLTKGVVSRIDYTLYTHSGVDSHLAIQVDAAINPGNSGGPILYRDRVVGVAFQGIAGAQNLGYAIPLPVIMHFLRDIEDGSYDGYPELGVLALDTRNPAMRRDLKITDKTGGVVVARIDPYGSAQDALKTGDVLTAIDGLPIAEDGTVTMNDQALEFTELIEQKQCGESVRIRASRNGKEREISIPLLKCFDPYIFRREYNQAPEYYICGGLVFTPLSMNLLAQSGKEMNEPSRQHLLYYAQFAKTDGLYSNQTQYVVLADRLAHRVNTYDDKFLCKTVSEINGVPIKQMSDLPRAFSSPSNNPGFAAASLHIIRFNESESALVLDAKAAQEADREIKRKYYISALYYLAGEELK